MTMRADREKKRPATEQSTGERRYGADTRRAGTEADPILG